MKTGYLILAGLVIAVTAFVLHTLYLAGSFRTIEPHFAGSCEAVEGVVGGEDITIDPEYPIAYISGYDRRAAMARQPHQGGIFRYHLEEENATPERLNIEPLDDFRPHGISLFKDDDGNRSLFVINHGGDQSTIEIFAIEDDDLVHRRTIRDPMITSPNNLHAVSHDQFYVTNDHGARSDLGRTLENYLRLPLANVVFFDGHEFGEAASGLRFANGVNQSPDGKTLYVAGTIEPGIYVYDRNPVSHELDYRHTIKLQTHPDNIEMDSDGNLWVGGISKLLAFVTHVDDPDHPVPAEVIRITPLAGDDYEITQVYMNDGSELSASSVAAVRGSRLLIGPVMDPHFLDCEMAAR